MRKKKRWPESYDIAMRSAPGSFPSRSRTATSEIHARMKELTSSRIADDTDEYATLLLALADLSVMAASFWKYQREAMLAARGSCMAASGWANA